MARKKKGRADNNYGTLYERKDGTFEVKFSVKDEDTGKTKRKSRYFKDKNKAEEFRLKVAAELKQGTYMDANNMTLGQWAEEWFKTYTPNNVRNSTLANYKIYIYQQIIPNIGHIKLNKLNLKDLQGFFNTIKAKGNLKYEGQPLSDKSVKNVYGMLNQCLNKAVVAKHIKDNPCYGVELPCKEEKAEIRVLSTDEREALINTLNNLEQIVQEKNEALKSEKSSIRYSHDHYGYRYVLFTSLLTGARIGEIMALKWENINFKKRTIKIEKTLNRVYDFDDDTENKTKLVLGTPKTSASKRIIPMNNIIYEKLLEYKQFQKTVKKICSDTFVEQGFVFANELGNAVEPRTIQDFFKKILMLSEIEDANLHCLRHTFATKWLESGRDVKTLSVILGHTNASFTMNRYIHCLEQHKTEQMLDFSY